MRWMPVWLLTLGLGCGLPVPERDDAMDSPDTLDPALVDPDAYLLSARLPSPTNADRQRPVVITAHGFQASSYEWVEFREYAEARGALVSLVVLGGHGRSTEAWVETHHPDWGAPILDEYAALDALGYENISIFCSSTGCPLTFIHQAEGRFDDFTPLRNLVMVAPFLAPQNELLYQARIVGPAIGNLPSASTEDEMRHYYHNRPWTVFVDLVDCINLARPAVEAGLAWPDGMHARILRASDETTVAEVSADVILDGFETTEPVVLSEYQSEHHIFTRKNDRLSPEDITDEQLEAGIRPWDDDDEANYRAAFTELVELLGLDDALP